MWGQPPPAVRSPKATALHRCYHDIVPPLLDIRNLNIAFPSTVEATTARVGAGDPPAQLLPAVRDLSFSIAPGEVLGLVGESGSGKSDHLARHSCACCRRKPASPEKYLFAENGNASQSPPTSRR